jgi:plasmid maintenance system antidote protein VapI
MEIASEDTMEGSIMPSQRRKLPPIHPGSILREDLEHMGISLNWLARDLRVPMNRISAIVNGKRYWMNLQTAYDLAVAGRTLAGQITRDVLPCTAA